jgi:hypothetical protein
VARRLEVGLDAAFAVSSVVTGAAAASGSSPVRTKASASARVGKELRCVSYVI